MITAWRMMIIALHGLKNSVPFFIVPNEGVLYHSTPWHCLICLTSSIIHKPMYMADTCLSLFTYTFSNVDSASVHISTAIPPPVDHPSKQYTLHRSCSLHTFQSLSSLLLSPPLSESLSWWCPLSDPGSLASSLCCGVPGRLRLLDLLTDLDLLLDWDTLRDLPRPRGGGLGVSSSLQIIHIPVWGELSYIMVRS